MANQENGHLGFQCRTEQPTEVDPELAEFQKQILTNSNVLPLFERGHSDFIHTRNYSLKNNQKLRSRWHERVMSGIDSGAIMAMPNINDYHFHNCRTKFLPSQSQASYPPPRMRLAPGPGVDVYGQRPIPDDMLTKKPKLEQPPAGKKKTKAPKSPKRLRRRSLY